VLLHFNDFDKPSNICRRNFSDIYLKTVAVNIERSPASMKNCDDHHRVYFAY